MVFDQIASDVELIRKGALANVRAVVALVFREGALRFGASKYSYVWTLMEPAIMIALLLIARAYMSATNTSAFGDSSSIFLLTGFMTFRISKGTIQQAGRSLGGNQALFASGMVTVMDTVVARTIVEYVIWLIVMTVFFTAVSRILHEPIITNFQEFCLALLLMFYFCFSMSMLNAVMGSLSTLWREAWSLMSLPLMFMSGVFYVPASMPPQVIEFISWNPFLHCVEGIRAASYLDFNTIYDPVYLMTFSTVALISALIIEALFRNQIIRAKYREDEAQEFI